MVTYSDNSPRIGAGVVGSMILFLMVFGAIVSRVDFRQIETWHTIVNVLFYMMLAGAVAFAAYIVRVFWLNSEPNLPRKEAMIE